MKLGIFYFVAMFLIFNGDGTLKEVDGKGYYYRSLRVCETVKDGIKTWAASDEFAAQYPDAVVHFSGCKPVEINMDAVSI